MTSGHLAEAETCALVRQSIVDATSDIVSQVIVKAREGSYLHAKFLFELAGIQLTGQQGEENVSEGSLAALLLERLNEFQADDTEGVPNI